MTPQTLELIRQIAEAKYPIYLTSNIPKGIKRDCPLEIQFKTLAREGLMGKLINRVEKEGETALNEYLCLIS